MVCWRICLADIKSHKLNLAEGALPPDYPKDNQACKKYVEIKDARVWMFVHLSWPVTGLLSQNKGDGTDLEPATGPIS